MKPLTLSLRPLQVVGHFSGDALQGVGGVARLVGQSFWHAFRRPIQPRALVYQVLQIGVRSLSLALTMAVFAGMVLAFQFGVGLERFGAKLYIGQTTVTALFRELAPLLTALVVGGRIGAGIAAELGVMAVTEQTDAMRALGADPLQRLVAPRILATMIALPLLAVCADIVGFFGGMLIAAAEYDVAPHLYTRGVLDFIEVGDFGSGLFKAVVFGFIIGAIACYEGMNTVGGTEGVGRATTRTVVASALCVLGTDFILTKLLISV
jgi:phospholipid/cholesterol/gamma-HCH transport system permease protein